MCSQTQSDAIRRNQTHSDAIRRHQTPSDAITRNQTQSHALRGTPRAHLLRFVNVPAQARE